MKPEKKIIRCAIYTRKSHEECLDMDYNTLDAQRDAGEKYIEAMRGEGWQVLPQHYDDGGFALCHESPQVKLNRWWERSCKRFLNPRRF